MIDCIILGDSIGVGTKMFRPECVSYVKGGINSMNWNKQYAGMSLQATTVVISLGTNDYKGINTYDELYKMRKTVKADRVFWIDPPCNDFFCKAHINEFIKQIAQEFNDAIIQTKKVQPDHVHPTATGYRELAAQTK